MSEDNTTPPPSYGTPEWWVQQARKEAETRAHGVDGLKEALPFLARTGITTLTMSYNGEGDSGDIEDIEIQGAETAPKTGEALDEALKMFPEETNAYARFCVEELKDRAFEILPAGFEINEGGYGQIVLDCENNKVRIEHNERIMEIRYDEQEW
jgi:hypothetical protein